MLSLTKIENNDGLEFQVDTENGLAYCSISAAARMLGVDKGNLSKYLKGVVNIEPISAEIQTAGGLQGVVLLSSEQVFKLALRYNLELAEKMGSAGANIYMLGLAGYRTVIEQPQPQRELAPQRDLIDYMQVIERFEYLAQDPLIKSLVAQRLAEELGSKALPSIVDIQVIVTVRAGELGYSQKQIGTGSQLGKFVYSRIQPTGKTQHGKYPVNAYKLTKELDDCIHEFFGAR